MKLPRRNFLHLAVGVALPAVSGIAWAQSLANVGSTPESGRLGFSRNWAGSPVASVVDTGLWPG
jgi:hypothetical protein